MTTAHVNSIVCFHELDTSKRRALILSVYQREPSEAFTDRQIASRLMFQDMNAVRPRISELIDDADLIECGNIRDSTTKKTVRVVRLRAQEEQMRFDL